MATSTSKVLVKLRVVRNGQVEVFSNSAKNVSSYPQMISNADSFAGTDLEFPLAGHCLGVGSSYFQASKQASSVMCILDDTTIASKSTYWTIERTLILWISIIGPSKWFIREDTRPLHNAVLLLNTELGLVLAHSIEDLRSIVPKVSVGWLSCGELVISPDITLAKDDDIVATSEGVPTVEHWLQ